MSENDPNVQNPIPAVADTKTIFTSKVFWGVVVSLIAAALNKWGKGMNAEMQNQTVDMILTIIAGAGGLFAIYGRISAKQPASLTGGTEKVVDVKRIIPFLLIPLMLLGCTSAGTNDYQKRATNDTPLTNDVRTMYATIVTEMTSLKKAGYFSDEEWYGPIKELRTEAGKIMESMEAAELIAQQTVLDAKAIDLRAVLDQLIDWRLKANTRKSLKQRGIPVPTTRPLAA